MLSGSVRLLTKLLPLVVVGAVVYVIVCGVQVVEASRLSAAPGAVRQAPAIIVIGQPVASADRSDLVARLRQAALLYRHGRAPHVVLTWSPPAAGSIGSVSFESKWLRHHGVLPSSLTELRASNSVVALSRTAKILGKGRGVIVVTDAIDALWTEGAGAGDGLSVQVSPPPSSKKLVFSEFGPLVREATAVAVGRVFGFGRISWAAY